MYNYLITKEFIDLKSSNNDCFENILLKPLPGLILLRSGLIGSVLDCHPTWIISPRKERINPAEPATPDFETGILHAEEQNGEGADKPEDKAADMDLNDTASEGKDESAPQPDAAETEAEKDEQN